MKKFLLGLLACLGGLTASASVITSFNTVGSSLSCGGNLNCTGGGSSITFTSGTATLTLTYATNTENNLNVLDSPAFSTTNFGTLTMTLGGSGDGSFNVAGATLSVVVNQTPNPFVASGGFGVANLGGILTSIGGSNGGSAQVTFSTTSFNLGPQTVGPNNVTIAYNLNTQSFPVNSYSLSINNPTTLQGALSATVTPVPEPTTYVLLGLGALALGAARRFKK